ncbi:MAG: hypothetical protein GF317_03940 [Candidatus Lokiarchaeota archaeon]|nr:hypothetical protein [Candidatus Lokiarchaeota archaeon]MBD3199037.1 hypothetical protein [Candidatus Lokiarchaeota archaeon]
MQIKNYQNLSVLAGFILIASSITHLLQLFFVGFEWHDLGAAIIGGFYGLLGVLLLIVKSNKVLTFIGIIFPFTGGTLGLVRLIAIEIGINGAINWFIVWHLIADGIVVPSLFFYYISFTNMDRKKKLSFLTIVMFIITAVIHILQLYYGITLESIGTAIFGFIYIGLGVNLWNIDNSKRIDSSIAGAIIGLPIIGGILGLMLFFLNYNPFLIFFLIVDVLIVILRIHHYNRYLKKK